METTYLATILEGAILAAGKPLSVQQMADLFDDNEQPEKKEIRSALEEVAANCDGRGFELQEVATGFRFQVRQELSPWVVRLWEERPQKYSRALLETLALIAYRQPLTRGDIEEIRGVSVSSNIIKTLLDRDWVKVVGHRDVPGRPAMYATTKSFLDYFNLKSLNELPALAAIRDLDTLNQELGFPPEVIQEAMGLKEVPTGDAAQDGEVEAEAESAGPEASGEKTFAAEASAEETSIEESPEAEISVEETPEAETSGDESADQEAGDDPQEVASAGDIADLDFQDEERNDIH